MFCSIQDVQNLMQITISDDKLLSIERAIEEATAAIQNYTNQTLELVESDSVTFDGRGGNKLYLPQLPVVSVSSVTVDDVALVVTTDYKLGQHGILYRVGNWWTPGIQNITVVYSHGYATLPDDIVSVCARAAARIYQAGLSTADINGNPSIASIGLGDYNVSYQSSPANDGGLLGVSAPRMLLLSEKNILYKYRVVNQWA